jgi:hypothetical protein
MKYWETIADNLSKAGWSFGWVSAQELKGAERSWIVDAHGYGKRFIVRAYGKLTAFVELTKGDTRVRGEFVVISAETFSGVYECSLEHLN